MKDETKTFNIIPDYDKLFTGFSRDARTRAEYIGQMLPGQLQDNARLEALRGLQSLLASISICACVMTTPETVEQFRDLLAFVVEKTRAAADKLEERLAGNEEDESKNERLAWMRDGLNLT